MNRSVFRLAAVAGLVALFGLCPPAPVLAETVPAKPAPSSSAPAPGFSREQALALVKQYFPVPEGGTVEAELESEGSRLVWQITYVIRHKGGGSSGYGIGQIDARTGQVLDLRFDNADMRPIRTGPLPAAQSEDEARTKAWKLVTDLYPARADGLRPAPNESAEAVSYGPSAYLDDEYVFSWVPFHGDIPVAMGGVTVTLDKYTLAYTGVHAEFPNMTFPSAAPTVKPAEALRLYRQQAQPRLSYLHVSERDPFSHVQKTSEMKLVYRMDGEGVLDAISGQFVGSSGEKLPAAGEPEAIPSGTAALITPPQLPLDDQSGMAFARQLLGLEEGVQADAHIPRFYNGENDLLFSFDTGEDGLSVTLDSETGLIRQAYRYRNQNFDGEEMAAPAPLDAAQQARAKAAAIAVVQRYYSPLVGDLKLEPQQDGMMSVFMPDVSLFFQRYVNGIPAGNDGVMVVLDAKTQDWTSLRLEWTRNAVFPKPEAVITPQQAADRLFTGRRALLTYMPKSDEGRYDFGPDGAYLNQDRPVEMMLSYELIASPASPGGAVMDSRTGEVLDWSGRTRDSHAASKVPSGHWAEGELRYMLAQRAITPEQLNPEAPLTRAEALRLLFTAQRSVGRYYDGDLEALPYKDIDRSDPLYAVVLTAVHAKVLQPEGENPVFGGDQPMTRAEFAVWLARSLELDELAQSGLVTVSRYKDAVDLTPEQRNATAFLQALGILDAGDQFHGTAQLTQADAAAFTVRLIKHMRPTR